MDNAESLSFFGVIVQVLLISSVVFVLTYLVRGGE